VAVDQTATFSCFLGVGGYLTLEVMTQGTEAGESIAEEHRGGATIGDPPDKFNVPSAHQTEPEPRAIVQMLTTTMSSHRKPRRQITGVAIPRGGPFLAVYYRSLIGS
jgi:hypothetical protein